ncbi:MAG: hypothetical protein MJZ41_13780, partial [Bacteroidaceae bacterium]|nr:hypothetical protein [Bacteroidaceae bacterium]
MKTFKILVILCSILIALTATTCEDNTIHYKMITLENKTEDSILYFYSFVKVDMDVIYGFGWFNNFEYVNPKEMSRFGVEDDESMVLYLTIVKQSTLDRYTKEEIIEKDIAEYFTYTYDYLKWRDFNIVYTGEQQQDSINLKEEQY